MATRPSTGTVNQTEHQSVTEPGRMLFHEPDRSLFLQLMRTKDRVSALASPPKRGCSKHKLSISLLETSNKSSCSKGNQESGHLIWIGRPCT